MRLKTYPELHRQLAESVTTMEPGECWIWTKGQSDGYGIVGARLIRHSPLHAHRFAYTLLVEPIPDGYHLHHECRQKLCCNPAHLRLVTRNEHSQIHAAEQRQTHCIRGHEYAIAPRGHKVCLTCDRERNRRNRALSSRTA